MRRNLLDDEGPIRVVNDDSAPQEQSGEVLVTRNHELIRKWAAQRGAEPATGESTPSGPATIDVHDGGAGIRFNFPAAAKFRSIGWDEWFQNFTQHDLMFVFEQDAPGQPPSTRFRLVPRERLATRYKLE